MQRESENENEESARVGNDDDEGSSELGNLSGGHETAVKRGKRRRREESMLKSSRGDGRRRRGRTAVEGGRSRSENLESRRRGFDKPP